MDNLRQFNGDVRTKEALLSYIVAHINQTALERMYKGENVAHIKDAKELIEGAFSALEDDYGIKTPEPKQITHAR